MFMTLKKVRSATRSVQILALANHLPYLSFLVLIIGDRVAICSRNYPEYLVAFWACRQLHSYYVLSHNFYCDMIVDLIGAVSVLVNA